MVLNEAPFPGMFAIVASTALAAAQGDLDSPTSKATAAVALATLLGLVLSAWRGLRTDRAVLRALDEGLGAGWRNRVQQPLRRRPWARILLLPGWMRQRDVVRIPNIRYGDAGRRNLLDIYRRRDTPQNGPVLIYFHGGGYTGGAKSREARPLLYRLADQGWVCISANYRLRPQTTFPGHQIDDEPDATPSPYQPYAYLNPGAPPFLIAHGTKDALATVEGARHFVDRLRRVSDGTVVYAELSGGQHAFDLFHSPRFEAVVDGVEAFATWVLTAPQNASGSTH